MEKQISKAVAQVVESLVENKAHQAAKYISPTLVVRATRPLFKGKIQKGNISMVLTIGKPNYKQREFIKDCKKVGEPFPVKGVILKFPPQKKK